LSASVFWAFASARRARAALVPGAGEKVLPRALLSEFMIALACSLEL